jgi:hypothetical protein
MRRFPIWQSAIPRFPIPRSIAPLPLCLFASLTVVAGCSSACPSSDQARLKATTIPSYDPKTGKLTRLTADLNKNGTIDTWTYMDGAVPLRSEEDRDEDGKIDRWEYVDPTGKVTSVQLSRMGTGKPDTWVATFPDGRMVQRFSPTGDERKITRWETYIKDELVEVAEDTNKDGLPDKWEKHAGVPILSVEFDENFDGVRDRRMTYGAAGAIDLLETEPDGRGGYLKRVKPQK